AGIKGLTPLEAFAKIYEAGEKGGALFVSRGDNSGTHQREILLWSQTGLNPAGRPWYLESGSGMAKTLLLANERGAYTLTDIGTFLKLRVKGKLPYLEVLIDKGELLENVYSVYLVNPSKVPGVNYELAREFADFVTSEKGQSIVGGYGVEEVGQPLFFPALGSGGLEEIWGKLSEG
ncbi:MAG: tungsten ABC transporter permease, partial [Thermoprotei archaeon]